VIATGQRPNLMFRLSSPTQQTRGYLVVLPRPTPEEHLRHAVMAGLPGKTAAGRIACHSTQIDAGGHTINRAKKDAATKRERGITGAIAPSNSSPAAITTTLSSILAVVPFL
jgi:hypothetical protein